MRELAVRLQDERRHALRVQTLTAGMSISGLSDDLKTFEAAVYNLAIIGEAVKFIPQEFRAIASEIPWRSIAGMRDLIVHACWQIEPAEVLNISATEITPLLEAIDKLLLAANSGS